MYNLFFVLPSITNFLIKNMLNIILIHARKKTKKSVKKDLLLNYNLNNKIIFKQ